jgi:hypothetical protein
MLHVSKIVLPFVLFVFVHLYLGPRILRNIVFEGLLLFPGDTYSGAMARLVTDVTKVTVSLLAGSFLLATGFCSSSTAFRFFVAASGSTWSL